MILEPWPLALAEEHTLIMGSDLTQGQSISWVLQAKAVLIFPRFILAPALAHTENGYLPLLVNLRVRSGEMSYLPEGQCFPPTYYGSLKPRHSPKTSPRG